jgi:RNA polymerase sigma-70 factor (ECF subfamily)
VIAAAISGLPVAQRTVIALRDVEGWSSEEVCEALEITAGNQRILLHRARSRVRQALEDYYGAVVEIDYDAVTARLADDTVREETDLK